MKNRIAVTATVRQRRSRIAEGGRKLFVGVMIAMGGQAPLFHVVDALGPRRRLTHFLDGRHQERNEDGNDGDDNEQLDQRKGRSLARHGGLLFRRRNKQIGMITTASVSRSVSSVN